MNVKIDLKKTSGSNATTGQPLYQILTLLPRYVLCVLLIIIFLNHLNIFIPIYHHMSKVSTCVFELCYDFIYTEFPPN